MANWWAVIDKIFDLIDYSEETDRPSQHDVTRQSAVCYGIDRTLFRVSQNEIWLYKGEAKSVLLYHAFHECWHAKQNTNKITLKYSDEDREKYVGKKHMFMLYKYDFEAEATGYAAAFVYYLSQFDQNQKQKVLEKIVLDDYQNMDSFTEDQFDSHEDFVNINNKLKNYYETGKKYFESLFNNISTSKSKELSELLSDFPILQKMISTKGSILINILAFAQ